MTASEYNPFKVCPECDGTGKQTRERPEPWVSRDTPPSLEEYKVQCDNCHGLGEITRDD